MEVLRVRELCQSYGTKVCCERDKNVGTHLSNMMEN